MTTTVDRLRAFATAATPGPWTAHAGPPGEGAAAFGVWVIFASGSGYPGARLEGRRAEADAAFIAALSPSRVLALADLVEAVGDHWQRIDIPKSMVLPTERAMLDALARVEEAFRESPTSGVQKAER